MQIYWLKIKKIIEEAHETKTYLLECPQDFTWEAGAHTHFALAGFNAGDKPNRNLVRHMSISTLPHEDGIGITTRIREQCSEFKTILKNLKAGDEVALFKTHSNIPLKRVGKNVYLLSSGVGLATFRPIVLDYFKCTDDVNQIHSLNVDSSRDFLFTDVFKTTPERNFTAHYVDNRKEYYEEVRKLAADKAGLFYIVGSDEFLVQNIKVLREQGVKAEQIVLDKHEQQLAEFLSFDMSN